jgi:hypothetical protein
MPVVKRGVARRDEHVIDVGKIVLVTEAVARLVMHFNEIRLAVAFHALVHRFLPLAFSAF